jgi:hypothetical protein
VDNVVVYFAHQWREWQPCSDNAAERMRNTRQNRQPNKFRTSSEQVQNKPIECSEQVPNTDRTCSEFVRLEQNRTEQNRAEREKERQKASAAAQIASIPPGKMDHPWEGEDPEMVIRAEVQKALAIWPITGGFPKNVLAIAVRKAVESGDVLLWAELFADRVPKWARYHKANPKEMALWLETWIDQEHWRRDPPSKTMSVEDEIAEVLEIRKARGQ